MIKIFIFTQVKRYYWNRKDEQIHIEVFVKKFLIVIDYYLKDIDKKYYFYNQFVHFRYY